MNPSLIPLSSSPFSVVQIKHKISLPLFLFIFLLTRYHISVVNTYSYDQTYVYLRHWSSIWTPSKGINPFRLNCLGGV